jgi:hypothetical protein
MKSFGVADHDPDGDVLAGGTAQQLRERTPLPTQRHPQGTPGPAACPGVSSVMTRYMAHKMGQLDIPADPRRAAGGEIIFT